jgi:exodeoxyribonuclease V alpha subunit
VASTADTTLEGTVDRISYRDEESAFTVAKLASPNGEITIVGKLVGVDEGMPLRLRGHWETDRKWGQQFRVDDYELVVPKTTRGIERFLGSKSFAGIGPSLAKRIVEKFGTETLEVIDKAPHRLTEVIGVGAARAKTIAKVISEQRHVQDVMVFLYGVGVSGAFAARIVKRYGKDSIRVVKANPYRLAHEVWGIGFRTADAIAGRLGMLRDAPERLEAGLLHALETSLEDGNLHLPDHQLIERTAELLEIDAALLPARLGALEASGLVVRELLGDRGPCTALPEYHEAEVASAQRLAELIRNPPRRLTLDIGAAIDAFEHQTSIELADEQRRAVRAALSDSCTVITGGPGVGKTTIVRTIFHLARTAHRKVALAAPTGRAAKRLSEATGAEAMTIHRLLEFNPQSGGFQRDNQHPLDADIVVVDEASMVDAMLFRALVHALRVGSQLVLVGDVDQLPSVGAGAVLSDVIASESVTVIRLTEIFRQAASSKIVTNAHQINRGEMPNLEASDSTSDFYFVHRDDPEAARAAIVDLVCDRIPSRFALDPISEVQVLTPMHRGELGTAALNRALQQRLNSGADAAASTDLVRGDRTFRRGDKVMQLRNDYERNVFNGDIGVIDWLDASAGALRVDFDGRLTTYERNELDQLVHAYAVSVHKSQGSEYPAVVISLVTQHYMMLQRSLLYTAVTRGKKLVVIVGTKRAIELAVGNTEARRRYTWLAERIRALAAVDNSF